MRCPFSLLASATALATVVALATGCGQGSAEWPPAPRNEKERRLMEAARTVVRQFDGWDPVLCVVEPHGRQWRVQAWKVVNPAARGRGQCVPWGVRGVILDDDANVLSYQSSL